jgi:hypothetical protein
MGRMRAREARRATPATGRNNDLKLLLFTKMRFDPAMGQAVSAFRQERNNCQQRFPPAASIGNIELSIRFWSIPCAEPRF